jgi:hypothetical protein
MTQLHAIAVRDLLGMPVWVWALVIFLGGLNEAIARSKWTAAESILQGATRALLKVPALGFVLARFPLLGDVLRTAAKLDKAEPAPRQDASLRALLPLLAVLALSGCATFKTASQLTLIELERGHTEASQAAKTYDAKVTADYIGKAAKTKTMAEQEALEAAYAKYRAGFAKFVEVMNKAWACIQQARAALPLIDQVSDPKRRAELTGYITSGLAFVLQGKDTLSAFGVQIGGAQ